MQHRIIISALFLLFAVASFAQPTSSRKQLLQEYGAISVANPQYRPADFLSHHKLEMGLGDSDVWSLQSEEAGKNGYVHFRYQQSHQGIPVYGNSYRLHAKGGKVVSANGSYLPKIKLNTTPALSLAEAVAIASQDMNGTEAPQKDNTKAAQLMPELSSFVSEPHLVIMDIKMPDFSGSYALAYKIELNSNTELDSKSYFIDAHSGIILNRISLLERESKPCQCSTLYYGEQTVEIDSISENEFVLVDPNRGADGIIVTDADGNTYVSDDNRFDENDAGYEKGAVDALYGTAKYYDILSDHFDWNGLDNNDKSFEIGVHAYEQDEFVNAFWNGRKVWVGNGDCNYGPLSSLTVVGHEFMHGIIDYTSRLIYSGESGAINESLADVMGKMLEYQVSPDLFNWGVGTVFSPEELEPFRILDNPNVKDHPEFYKGNKWTDNNDVHINSAIGNLWYVLIAEGRTASDQTGQPYAVSAMGHLEAAQFIFHVNRFYLTENSGYNAYYNASLLAAEELFPGDASFRDNIIEAWKAVGLPNEPDELGEYVDLALTTQSLYSLCGYGSYLSAYVDVTNLGSLKYEPSMNGKIIVEDGSNNILREIELTEGINLDTTIRIRLDSILEIDEYFSRMTVDLELGEDRVPENDSDRTFALTQEFVTGNLAVSMSYDPHKCFSDKQSVTVVIRNESCEMIPLGTEMDLVIKDSSGEIVYSENYMLERNLNRSSAVDFKREFLMPRKEDETFTISLDVPTIVDPDPSNNENSYELLAFKTVDKSYSNSFSEPNDLIDELYIVRYDYAPIPLDVINGDSAFFVKGTFVSTDELMCPEAEDNFTGEADSPFDNIKAIVTLCADLEEEVSPSVYFDLVQNRNLNNKFFSDATSSMQLMWEDVQSLEKGKQNFLGQPDGARISNAVALPSQFKGRLTFNFVAMSEEDIQYLDNLHFDQDVSTENVEAVPLRIFPNPTSAILEIAGSKSISGVQVFDTQGRLVMEGEGMSLDVTELVAGCYLLKVFSVDGHIFSERFIKI